MGHLPDSNRSADGLASGGLVEGYGRVLGLHQVPWRMSYARISTVSVCGVDLHQKGSSPLQALCGFLEVQGAKYSEAGCVHLNVSRQKYDRNAPAASCRRNQRSTRLSARPQTPRIIGVVAWTDGVCKNRRQALTWTLLSRY